MLLSPGYFILGKVQLKKFAHLAAQKKSSNPFDHSIAVIGFGDVRDALLGQAMTHLIFLDVFDQLFTVIFENFF